MAGAETWGAGTWGRGLLGAVAACRRGCWGWLSVCLLGASGCGRGAAQLLTKLTAPPPLFSPPRPPAQAVGRDVPLRIPYCGRPAMASTATGFGEVHAQEQSDLIRKALDVGGGGGAAQA